MLPDYIQNACIEVSMDELKSVAVKGCWKKLCPEAVTPRDSPNQQDKVRNILILAYKVPGFPDLYPAAIQEILHCHSAELSVGDTEELAALSVPKDTQDCCAVMKRPELMTSALNEGLQIANDTVPADV